MRCRIKNYKHYTTFNLTALTIVIAGMFLLSSPTATADEPPDKEWVVVIDAGHGGKDPGAIGKRSREKDIALKIALKTGKYIEELIDGVKVIYTRKDDTFIELYRRSEIANEAKADLLISIHCNGFGDTRVHGSETYVMGLSNNESNLRVALKENSVIMMEEDYETRYQGYDPNSSESFIAFSLVQNIYIEQSLSFANFIQDQFRERVGLHDRGVKQASLIVLWKATMPSVLVETSYLTNLSDEKFLMSNEGQDFIASAIFRAFRDYKTSIDRKSNFSTIEKTQTSDTGDDDICFMVQLATSSVKHEEIPEEFRNIGEISEIISGKYYKYAAGRFSTYKEAAERRKELQSRFPDAFVIAVRNMKIIPLQEAIEQTGGK